MQHINSVDDYIASFPKNVQSKLKTLRTLVKDLAPEATEKISYGIPSYHLNGRLIYFAAFKKHIGFYPMKSVIGQFKDELTAFDTSAGTIRFSLDKPLPQPLIRRIIRYRIDQNKSKKQRQ